MTEADDLPRMEDDRGVHVMLAYGGQATLCGDAEDAYDSGDSDHGPMTNTTKRTVTCPDCVRAILSLRKVRVRRPETAAR